MRYWFAVFLFVLSSPTMAYVGPGPGLSMLGSALGLVGAVAFALIVVLAYPLRLLYIKIRGQEEGQSVIQALLGLLIGFPAMWLYSRLANLSKLGDLKTRKRSVMKKAFTHTGPFAELLAMQREILLLSLQHMRLILFPALISCLPIIVFVMLRPEFTTIEFALGILVAYLIAKWRFGI